MISSLKNKSALGVKSEQGRDRLDSKIKANPLESFTQVKDGRSERVMFGDSGAGKWASKQAGLTWSDTR